MFDDGLVEIVTSSRALPKKFYDAVMLLVSVDTDLSSTECPQILIALLF